MIRHRSQRLLGVSSLDFRPLFVSGLFFWRDDGDIAVPHAHAPGRLLFICLLVVSPAPYSAAARLSKALGISIIKRSTSSVTSRFKRLNRGDRLSVRSLR